MRYNSAMDLTDKIFHFTQKRLETLERLHIQNSEQLLSYYPSRYDVLCTKQIEQWKIKEKITFQAEVISRVSTFRRGKFVTSSFQVMHDDSIIKITIFNRPWANQLQVNQILTITGIYMGNHKVTAMNYDTKPLSKHDMITPIYATKDGIQQRTIRDSIQKVYEAVQNEIQDYVPEEMIRKYRLLRKSEAIRRIHFPQTENDTKLAIRTLKYEEFLRFFIALQLNKNEEGLFVYKEPKIFSHQKIEKMIQELPFSLTMDQKETINQILKELSSTNPMYRLVQGDVGCGKTIVAVISLYACALSGFQCALLAPTEILAKQHYDSLCSLIKDDSIHIDVLFSGLNNNDKNKILKECENGEIDILVGTHALIQDSVKFKNLGYVVADEQQRFGVNQRKALRLKGNNTDFLLMSATPIPRTLASTIFGDMEVSTIETMPEGRKEPITKLIQENSFRTILSDVNEILESGHQLYVICAAVEENEDYKARDVFQMQQNLTKLFSNYKVGMLHGKMSSEEKQNIMQEFYENHIQVLVSTTVVEVGMNVVNATGMIIYDADRFGLSQLHQLRGRIQRGNEQGKCWLLTDNKNQDVIQRLNVLVKTNNGFEISYEDLRLRGPGDILGTRQSGVPDLILGNLYEDTNMIQVCKDDAFKIVQQPENPDYIRIVESVKRRREENSEYVD